MMQGLGPAGGPIVPELSLLPLPGVGTGGRFLVIAGGGAENAALRRARAEYPAAVHAATVEHFKHTAQATLREGVGAAMEVEPDHNLTSSSSGAPTYLSSKGFEHLLRFRGASFKVDQKRAAALRETLSDSYATVQDAGEACAQASEFLGNRYPERSALVDFADVLTGIAELEDESGNGDRARAALQGARHAIDFALNFVPFVGFAKDVSSLILGVNHLTGEVLGAGDRGLLMAGLLVPSAMRGTLGGVTHASGLLRRIAVRTGRSSDAARKFLPALEEASRIVSAYGTVAEEVFASPHIQPIASKWGTSAGKLNQLLVHTLGKAITEPKRLEAIERYAARPAGTVSGIITDKSVRSIETALTTTHEVAEEVVRVGEKLAGARSQTFFWKASAHNPEKGLAVVVYENKLQTVMVVERDRFVKMAGRR